MLTRMVRSKGVIEVVYNDPDNEFGDTVSVAAMTLYEGTGCWILSDWRLSQHKVLSPWSSSIDANDVYARYRAETPEEQAFVKSLLKEYEEREDGELVWCTFDNFYRGHPDVDGRRPGFRSSHLSGYFGYKEALTKLREIRAFWDAFEGDPKTARIHNPNGQLSASQVYSEVALARLEGRVPKLASASVA
jgi:hypothetical protein